ncbi:MAG: V-type ATP synthase subunit E [Oscillospiraceae bacterium]|jgi:vacuolar-type H+-ATPase subunit E/Vma4|nr:V-type ATP synthase subunit E [Oscillospiraceae bacterium]
MDNPEEKLRHFTDAILTDAREETDTLYGEIKSEEEAFMSAAVDEALAGAFRYIKTEVARIESDCGRRLSRAVMANKREIFLRREAMADEVMEAVGERLAVFTGTPGYGDYLESVLMRLLDILDGDIIVCLRPEDAHLEAMLADLSARRGVTFADGNFSLGGMEVSCPQKGLHADATFDTRVDELRGHFFELFGLKLGE